MENRKVIEIGSKLSDMEAVQVNNALRDLDSGEDVYLDFTKLKFAEPYGMLFLAQSIREFIEVYSPKKLTAKVKKREIMLMDGACHYMAHVGFFKDAGIEHGNNPGKAPGSSTHIPITKISCQESHEFLEVKAEELAKILVYDEQGEEYRDILQYVIFESLRNAMEHSDADCVRICGQRWDNDRTGSRAEIAILDAGIGVLESLNRNTLYSALNSERDALEKAIEPGVSRSLISKRSNNPMDNSGYGLYMLKRICKESGNFLLVSNGTGLRMQKGRDDSWAYSKATGTSLKIEINLNELLKLGNLHKILARYRSESKSPVKPSASSMASNIK